jgi:hypothetical protein
VVTIGSKRNNNTTSQQTLAPSYPVPRRHARDEMHSTKFSPPIDETKQDQEVVRSRTRRQHLRTPLATDLLYARSPSLTSNTRLLQPRQPNTTKMRAERLTVCRPHRQPRACVLTVCCQSMRTTQQDHSKPNRAHNVPSPDMQRSQTAPPYESLDATGTRECTDLSLLGE